MSVARQELFLHQSATFASKSNVTIRRICLITLQIIYKRTPGTIQIPPIQKYCACHNGTRSTQLPRVKLTHKIKYNYSAHIHSEVTQLCEHIHMVWYLGIGINIFV